MATANTEHNAQASPARVEEHLSGVDYPKSRDELVSIAKKQNAPDDVVSVLKRMPNREYDSAADVAKGIGDVE